MKQMRNIFLLAALAMFAVSCVRIVEDGRTTPRDEDRLVTLSLSVPGTPASRGLSEAAENAVNAIDVLLFRTSDDYFYYRAIGSDIGNDGDNAHKKFTVKLPEGTWNVVVLANARAALAGSPHATLLTPSTLVTSTVTRATILGGLVQQLSDRAKKWTDEGFPGIPMWGYHNGLVIGAATPSPAADVALTRSIARVDVSVGTAADVALRAKFSLASVHLYNYSRAGSLSPVAGAIATNGGYTAAQWDGSKAVAPNLPALTLLVDKTNPLKVSDKTLVYTVHAAQKHEYKQEIYTFEAAAGASTSLSTNTCLVLGGYYNSSASPSYYRVEFVRSDGTTYLPLLRNHNYNVVIQSVDGEGYPTPGGAFNNKPANIKAEVLPWNDGSLGEVIFDGQNYLGVSPGEFTLYRDATTGNEFTVRTDVAGGWTISGVTDAPGAGGTAVTWIGNVSGSFSGAGNKDVVTFSASENTGGAARVAYIHVKAGRLDFAVKVTQGITRDVRVWITGASDDDEVQELIFTSAVGVLPAAQQFLLHWLPANVTVSASTSSMGTAFSYYASSDRPGTVMTSISDPSGKKLITIRPTALTQGDVSANPFIEKFSKVDFTVFSDGKYASRGIYLRQVHFNTEASVDAFYILDGGQHSFTVRSNTEWKISAVSDPQHILQATPVLVGQSGGYNTATGETVNFKLVTGSSSLMRGTVTLTLTDPTTRVGNVTVTIKGVTCGMDGNALSLSIGNNGPYKVHMYGDKCWMVENSKEGTYSGKAFGCGADGNPIGGFYDGYSGYRSQLNGYYYTYAQASTACPAGWHLPTEAEIADLMIKANADNTGIGKWWLVADENAYAGYYNFSSSIRKWDDWRDYGCWWGAPLNNLFRTTYIDNVSTLIGLVKITDRWVSVRCVLD